MGESRAMRCSREEATPESPQLVSARGGAEQTGKLETQQEASPGLGKQQLNHVYTLEESEAVWRGCIHVSEEDRL